MSSTSTTSSTTTSTTTGQKDPDTTFSSAVNPTRNLTFFTITTFAPMILLTGSLLMGLKDKGILTMICIVAVLTAGFGLSRLLYEILMDISGYPDFKLPIWIVAYLFVYVVSGFTAIYFILDHRKIYSSAHFDEALFHGLEGFLGQPYSGNAVNRFIGLSQNLLSAFINAVIITKFVSSF